MVLSTWGQGIEAIPSAAHVCLCVYKFSARKFGNEGQKKRTRFLHQMYTTYGCGMVYLFMDVQTWMSRTIELYLPPLAFGDDVCDDFCHVVKVLIFVATK